MTMHDLASAGWKADQIRIWVHRPKNEVMLLSGLIRSMSICLCMPMRIVRQIHSPKLFSYFNLNLRNGFYMRACMHGAIHTLRCVHAWIHGYMHGWMDGWMAGRIGGLMNGFKVNNVWVHASTCITSTYNTTWNVASEIKVWWSAMEVRSMKL